MLGIIDIERDDMPAGRYSFELGGIMRHKETGQLYRPKPRSSEFWANPSINVGFDSLRGFEDYESPITGEPITSKRARAYDLAKAGCVDAREYDGEQLGHHKKVSKEEMICPTKS